MTLFSAGNVFYYVGDELSMKGQKSVVVERPGTMTDLNGHTHRPSIRRFILFENGVRDFVPERG